MNWKTVRVHIQKGIPPQGMDLVKNSFVIMDVTHDGETRDDGKPYRDHPVRSLFIAYDMGEWDPEVLAAILSHDVLESSKSLGKPMTVLELETHVGTATACRTSWMTKKDHTTNSHVVYWSSLRCCRDHKTLKAKSYERLDNVSTFGKMKAKGKETREMRIKRKLDETVREFVPIVNWLLADLEIRAFKSEDARDKERILVKKIRHAFEQELAKYGRKFETNK
ncbi:TPA: hypothetical protein DEP94_01655 [Candidatus Nomurabacteria bacterium]|nr:hypothetical protein [Candidatus Nomurabacteria bacterium]